MIDIKKEIDENYFEALNIRRIIHSNPEVGFDCFKTLNIISDKLKEYNITPLKCNEGLVAYIGLGSKTILLRSDIDALEIKEQTHLDFKSTNNYMHACGHDIHTAILLTTCKILKRYEHLLKVRVKVMFQPAEEILSGAKNMIEGGVVSDCDAAFMLHVLSRTKDKTGMIYLKDSDIIAPSSDFFKIDIYGKSTHGAMPEKGLNPINPSIDIISGFNSLLVYEKSFNDKALITTTSIICGQSYNVLPETCSIKASLRTYDENLRKALKTRIKDFTQRIAHAYSCDTSIEFISQCPVLVNDKILRKKVLKILQEKYTYGITTNLDSTSSGSEDFAYVSQQIPSVSLTISAGSKNDGYIYPLHNPKVVFDENVIKCGIEAFLLITLNYV